MILQNHTRHASADLERIILGALAEFGITSHAHDRVRVASSAGGYSGYCYYGRNKPPPGRPRMWLRIPPEVDVPRLVWLVRHEVAHWANLRHAQMGTALRYWSRDERLRPVAGPVGCERPIPAWAEGLTVAVVADVEPVVRKIRREVDADARRAKRIEHARTMLARAERRAKIAATCVKRWRRRLAAAERAQAKVATKAVAA